MDSKSIEPPDPVVFADGRWLVGGLIAYFHRERERLRVEDGGLDQGLPQQCMDPVRIAAFLGVPIEEMDWRGRKSPERCKPLGGSKGNWTGGRAPPAEYFSIREAAALTRLSYSHVRRAILAGELPASNVGSPAHALHRVARTDLTAWMNTKKGGSVVPPKSERRGLVDRYFG